MQSVDLAVLNFTTPHSQFQPKGTGNTITRLPCAPSLRRSLTTQAGRGVWNKCKRGNNERKNTINRECCPMWWDAIYVRASPARDVDTTQHTTRHVARVGCVCACEAYVGCPRRGRENLLWLRGGGTDGCEVCAGHVFSPQKCQQKEMEAGTNVIWCGVVWCGVVWCVGYPALCRISQSQLSKASHIAPSSSPTRPSPNQGRGKKHARDRRRERMGYRCVCVCVCVEIRCS